MDLRQPGDDSSSSLVSLGYLTAGDGSGSGGSHDEEEGSIASGHSGYHSGHLAGILAKDEGGVTTNAVTSGPLEKRKRRRVYVRRCARAVCTLVALAALSGSAIYLIAEEEPLLESWSEGVREWFSGDARADEGGYRRLPELDAAEEGTTPDHPYDYHHDNAGRERVRKHIAHRDGQRAENRNFPAVHPEQQRYLRSEKALAIAERAQEMDLRLEEESGRDGEKKQRRGPQS